MKIGKKGRLYDPVFKRMVVDEYLATRQRMQLLQVKYGIKGKSTLQRWVKDFGYPYKKAKTLPTFGQLIFATLKKPADKATNEELLKKIRQLERQLEDEKLRSEIYIRIIDKAEKEMNIPIRKKPNTK